MQFKQLGKNVLGLSAFLSVLGVGLVTSVGHGKGGSLIKSQLMRPVSANAQSPVSSSHSTLPKSNNTAVEISPSTLGRGSASATPQTSRTSQLVCSISFFFSSQPENRLGIETELDGRGLLNCKNDQGFTTEVPVMANLEAVLPDDLEAQSEVALSGNTSVFVIPREISQIQDGYSVREFNTNRSQTASPNVVFRGKRHDLVIDMKLTSRTMPMGDIKIKGLSVRFDETAPDLASVGGL